MNKWYRKSAVKAGVLIAGVLSGAAFLTSFAVGTTFAGTVNPAEIMEIVNEPYEESVDFKAAVSDAMSQIFRKSQLEKFFEMDGAYNPDKVIDVLEYYRDGRSGGENVSGIAYTLEELINWGEDFASDSGDAYNNNEVIVCQKPDGGYYYYYFEDFQQYFSSG